MHYAFLAMSRKQKSKFDANVNSEKLRTTYTSVCLWTK